MEGKICWTKKKLNKIIKWKHFVKVLYNTTCKWLIYIFLNSLCFLLLKKIKTNASCLFSNNVWQKWTKLEFEWKFQKNKLSGCLSQVSDTIFLSFNNSPKFLNIKRINITLIFALCSFLLCQKYFLFCKIIMKILWIMKERERVDEKVCTYCLLGPKVYVIWFIVYIGIAGVQCFILLLFCHLLNC